MHSIIRNNCKATMEANKLCGFKHLIFFVILILFQLKDENDFLSAVVVGGGWKSLQPLC